MTRRKVGRFFSVGGLILRLWQPLLAPLLLPIVAGLLVRAVRRSSSAWRALRHYIGWLSTWLGLALLLLVLPTDAAELVRCCALGGSNAQIHACLGAHYEGVHFRLAIYGSSITVTCTSGMRATPLGKR